MAAVAAGDIYVYEADTGSTQIATQPSAYKEIVVCAAATADNGDTIAVTLASHGITTFKYIKGFVHTTENEHIIDEAPTTSVTAGVLTITVGGATPNKFRAYIVGGI